MSFEFGVLGLGSWFMVYMVQREDLVSGFGIGLMVVKFGSERRVWCRGLSQGLEPSAQDLWLGAWDLGFRLRAEGVWGPVFGVYGLGAAV